MAHVSSKQFYFAEFGGYSGLQQALAQDLLEIENLADSELTRPGTYYDVLVAELMHLGQQKYQVLFETGDNFLHRDILTDGQLKQIVVAGGAGSLLHSVTLIPAKPEMSAGYLRDMFYLIDMTGNIQYSFETAQELITHCRQVGVNLQGLKIHDICTHKAGTSS